MTAGGRRMAMAVVAATIALSVSTVGSSPATSTQPDIVLLGDSLTAANLNLIRQRVEAGGITSVHYAAVGGRRINVAVRFDFDGVRRSSGVEEVRRLKSQGVDPELWVVELGTNDLYSVASCGCADRVAFAGALIDTLVAEIGPGEPIAWVTVLSRTDTVTSEVFNRALRRRAAVDPLFILIDWYERGLDHPEWFIDHVHHNLAGVDAFAAMYVEAFGGLLADPLDAPRTGRPGAQRVVHDGFGRADLAR